MMTKEKLIYWLILLSLFIFLLDYLGLVKPIKEPIEATFILVKKEIYNSKLVLQNSLDILAKYQQLDSLLDRVRQLEKENQELSLKVRSLTEENSKLRSQLGTQLPGTFDYRIAPVVGVSRFMQLAVGEREGVRMNMPVIDGDVLIGKIITVTPKTSSVLLLTDAESQVAAKTSRGASAIVLGQFGKNIILEKVLQKEPLFIDDQVVTSGADGLPPNLIIGKIKFITSDEVSAYKKAQVESPLDFAKETTVFIVF